MKQILSSILFLVLAIPVSTASTQDAKRTATITDTSGIASAVTDVSFSAQLQEFDSKSGRIALSAQSFDIAIPLDNLISIEAR